MSLDITLYLFDPTTKEGTQVFDGNITHNLGKMADEAGIYYAMWRPEEKGWKKAGDILKVLEEGLDKLKKDPEKFKKFNPKNGWGSYEALTDFVCDLITACKKFPTSEIEVSR